MSRGIVVLDGSLPQSASSESAAHSCTELHSKTVILCASMLGQFLRIARHACSSLEERLVRPLVLRSAGKTLSPTLVRVSGDGSFQKPAHLREDDSFPTCAHYSDSDSF